MYLSLDATKTIVHVLIYSRLDYCNSLYYGLPNTQIQRLQRIQNAAAWIILKPEEIRPYHSSFDRIILVACKISNNV